jgi:hypothetical protein
MGFLRFLPVCAVALAGCLSTRARATVTIGIEAAGVASSSLTGYKLGVETLDTAPNGVPTLTFGNSGITATNSGFINIGQANVYGGAGGSGAFGTINGDTTISLSQAVNYFGIWGSALDGQNSVELYNNATLLGSFALQAILEASPGYSSAYKGNPFNGGDTGENFAFFNFTSDTAFNKIRLVQNSGGGFEFDNLTVGTISAAPEPATWAMLLFGFGAVGMTLRSERRMAGVSPHRLRVVPAQNPRQT